jgi:hypothetical protein
MVIYKNRWFYFNLPSPPSTKPKPQVKKPAPKAAQKTIKLISIPSTKKIIKL